MNGDWGKVARVHFLLKVLSRSMAEATGRKAGERKLMGREEGEGEA